MYADGELILNMGYGAPQDLVDTGQLPESTRSFILDTGTVGNSNFMAIANAPHKAALVAINEVVSPEMQLSIYENLGNISVLDMAKLPEADSAAFAECPSVPPRFPLTSFWIIALPSRRPGYPIREAVEERVAQG